ncbi:hypothetical protein Plec18167_002536 [Paecilomyces lecythidis]|uniref:Ubiquitin-like domain-containing protein n=1 Tax=Paecilomyces lecythidis TaxID=3004212 RepID=A0ABR3Y5G3_9EURO
MSFFKKPSWASTQDDDSTTHFYQRSQHIYADIVAASQRSRSKEAESAEDAADSEDRGAPKKRRISHSPEDEPSSQGLDGDRYSNSEGASDRPVVESAGDSSPTNLTSDVESVLPPRKTKRLSGPKPKSVNKPESELTTPVVVSSSGSESDSERRVTTETSAPAETTVQRAPERNSPKRVQSNCPDPIVVREDTEGRPIQPLGLDHNSRDESRAAASASPRESDEQDPIVQILITSNIENTTPLIVRRKMSQRLRDVRLAWCKRQGFDKDMTASVFLTWKGKRLFDVTTCKSLGIGIQNRANSQSPWDASDEGGDKEESMQIHVEAVTDLPVAPSRRQTPSGSAKEPSSRASVPPDDEQDTGGHIRMILKAPGYGDQKIKVRPNTRISKVIASFRDAQRISAEKQLYLLFDGERLSPDSCVSDYDIDDLDMVDVQIK